MPGTATAFMEQSHTGERIAIGPKAGRRVRTLGQIIPGLPDGIDIRSYAAKERTRKIGFILQEPFLFTGTIRDNVLYGNEQYHHYSDDELIALMNERNVGGLLSRFERGLQTNVAAGGDAVSLGQKQIIAFVRAVLRNPEILILDGATANIDTVTEQQLEQILDKLPPSTTKVIVAHRLNTWKSAFSRAVEM